MILKEAAVVLDVSKMTVTRLIKNGVLPAKQACRGAPYVIRRADLELPIVRRCIVSERTSAIDTRQGSFVGAG